MSVSCRLAARGFVFCCLVCVLRPLAAAPAVPAAPAAPSAPAAAAAPAAEDFSIKLNRPAKVGDRTLLTGSYQADEDTVVTVAGRENRQEKHAIYRFAVVHKVLAVGAKGNTQRAELAVQKMSRETDGATTELL